MVSKNSDELTTAGTVLEDTKKITDMFKLLTKTLSVAIKRKHLNEIKQQLIGHVDTESLDRAWNGRKLIECLMQRRLFHEKKTAFVKNILRSVSNNQELLDAVRDFEISVMELMRKNDISPKRIIEDKKSLHEIRKRSEISLQECISSLDRCNLNMNTMQRSKSKILEEIADTKKNVDETSCEKKDFENKFYALQKEQESISEKLAESNNLLFDLCGKRENHRTKIQELSTGGMSAKKSIFQTTLERKLRYDLDREITSLTRKILNQKQLIMTSEEDLKILHLKLDTRRNRLRLFSVDIQNFQNKLIELHENVLAINQDIMEIINERSRSRLAMTEIQYNIDVIEKQMDVKHDGNSETECKCNLEELKQILRKTNRDTDYSLLGRHVYTLGNYQTSSQYVKLHQPITVDVDQNGDIVVIDEAVRLLLNFTAYGELNFKVDLNTMKAIALSVDPLNNYIVVSSSLIRIYRRTELVRQFLPYFKHSRMSMPDICSVDFNRYTDELLLLDRSNRNIQVFCLEGDFLYIQDIPGVDSPEKLCIVSKTSFALTDSKKHCIHIYETRGHALTSHSYGNYGIGICEFVKPRGLNCDTFGRNLLVCDTGNHRLYIIDSNGNHIKSLGNFGRSKHSLNCPTDVAIHWNYRMVLVADKENSRIVLYL